ncbi:phage regulatory CII family protein [Halodesulfovibrio sp.]|uniref:phage regulatory CII family protein n=1 Tax=Halodesulfovibrio sp. TaxID=1912772 RepID=UPI0025DFFE8D|nr:phage regulatory CII family protein [Halodesulfovibrio sp.]MCT4534551.1 amino acid-binding protein [Halodesulfovibrio sp.]MCT4626049.1 amino acid-binding protein [Halodesulfovibrio sp.]
MRSELTKIVHELVLNSPIPAKALAKEIGKPYSTLLREVNPYDAGAKLGVETLMDIMKKTGNVEPLEYIAQEMGFAIVDPKLMTEPNETATLADIA